MAGTSIGSSGVTFPDATVQSTAVTSAFPSGTAVIFAQTAAPTGWTKVTTYNDYALRVVNGTASTGGSVAFSTAFASQGVSGTVGNTTITTTTMPSHAHQEQSYTSTKGGLRITNTGTGSTTATTTNMPTTANNGSDGAHAHSFSGTAINLAVQYVDVIIATKN